MELCNNCSDIQDIMNSAALVSKKSALDGLYALKETYPLLKNAYQSGRRVLYMSDCNFENLMEEVGWERYYTYLTYLKCPKCNKYFYLGICVRGRPVFKIMDNPPDKDIFCKSAEREEKRIYMSDEAK
ncbi:hypothetical protein [Huintestinicola sp.]|uniref:hypothetical protein n=1 Tax=Huintestinicola sp. TaxID=2981661 RepID=UPI003D7E3520